MKPSKIVWFASPRGQDKLLYSKALNSVNLLILFYSTFTGQQNMQKMSVQLLVLFRFDGIHFKFVALSEICLYKSQSSRFWALLHSKLMLQRSLLILGVHK